MGIFDLKIDTSNIDFYSKKPQQLDRDVAHIIEWFNRRRREIGGWRTVPLVLQHVTKSNGTWRNYRYRGGWPTYAAKCMIWNALREWGYVIMNARGKGGFGRLGNTSLKELARIREDVLMDSQVRQTTPPRVFSERHDFDPEIFEIELLPDNYAKKSDVISLGMLAKERLRLGYHVGCIVHPDISLVKFSDGRWTCPKLTCGFSFREPRS